MGALGLIFGALLAYASIRFWVKVDKRTAAIRAILPGANCASCGYPGCDGYAEAITSDGADPTRCAPGGAETARKIAEIMGVEAAETVPMRAFVKCKGTPDKAPRAVRYAGSMDCRSASVIPGGTPKGCPNGCIGLGSCVAACRFGAIDIVGGIARVDISKCTGCGSCASACPKGVISIIPMDSEEQVYCNSNMRGVDIWRVCAVGCIGCGLCARLCPERAIKVEDELARIDAAACRKCGICMAKCPTKNIASAKAEKL